MPKAIRHSVKNIIEEWYLSRYSQMRDLCCKIRNVADSGSIAAPKSRAVIHTLSLRNHKSSHRLRGLIHCLFRLVDRLPSQIALITPIDPFLSTVFIQPSASTVSSACR
jgi:hypothetical protein